MLIIAFFLNEKTLIVSTSCKAKQLSIKIAVHKLTEEIYFLMMITIILLSNEKTLIVSKRKQIVHKEKTAHKLMCR